jgi:hypothetical protein
VTKIERGRSASRRRVGAGANALDGPFPPKPPKMRWARPETSGSFTLG